MKGKRYRTDDKIRILREAGSLRKYGGARVADSLAATTFTNINDCLTKIYTQCQAGG
jgi:hypothetical protein